MDSWIDNGFFGNEIFLSRELRPLLVFLWAKILAVDSSCQQVENRNNNVNC